VVALAVARSCDEHVADAVLAVSKRDGRVALQKGQHHRDVKDQPVALVRDQDGSDMLVTTLELGIVPALGQRPPSDRRFGYGPAVESDPVALAVKFCGHCLGPVAVEWPRVLPRHDMPRRFRFLGECTGTIDGDGGV